MSSPMPKGPGDRLAASRSMTSLGRPQSRSTIAPRNGNGQVTPSIPTVNGSQPSTIQEWRKMLEETKKEVREIKAIESSLKWNMQREDKKEKFSEAKATVEEMRDW